jgi:hypothetical protein
MAPARIAALVAAALIALVIIIMVATPYLILARIMEYNMIYLTMRAPRAMVSEIYPLLKTGDLLMFVSSSHLPANSGIVQIYYTHTAMLMREGDLIYTTESQTGTEVMPNPDSPGTDYHMKKGAASAPFLTRVKFYTGTVYVMRLSRPLDPAREQCLKATADRLHSVGYPYPTMQQAFGAALLGRKVPARHCFQHVAHLLDEARLTPLGLDAPLADSGIIQVCRDVCGLPGRALPDGYSYDPPIALMYDIGALGFDEDAIGVVLPEGERRRQDGRHLGEHVVIAA